MSRKIIREERKSMVSRSQIQLRKFVAGHCETTEERKQCKEKLLKAVEGTTMLGVAANQVGIDKRVMCIRIGNRFEVMFDPIVNWSFGSKKSLEGCASFDGRYFVKRPRLAKISWKDEEGNEHSRIYGFKLMRRVMHEIDHLNGVLISDTGEYWKYTKLAEELKKEKENKK